MPWATARQKNTGTTVLAPARMVVRCDEYCEDCECDWPHESEWLEGDCELGLLEYDLDEA